jgi:hypothetical protein
MVAPREVRRQRGAEAQACDDSAYELGASVCDLDDDVLCAARSVRLHSDADLSMDCTALDTSAIPFSLYSTYCLHCGDQRYFAHALDEHMVHGLCDPELQGKSTNREACGRPPLPPVPTLRVFPPFPNQRRSAVLRVRAAHLSTRSRSPLGPLLPVNHAGPCVPIAPAGTNAMVSSLARSDAIPHVWGV